jgi:hypothetical protein
LPEPSAGVLGGDHHYCLQDSFWRHKSQNEILKRLTDDQAISRKCLHQFEVLTDHCAKCSTYSVARESDFAVRQITSQKRVLYEQVTGVKRVLVFSLFRVFAFAVVVAPHVALHRVPVASLIRKPETLLHGSSTQWNRLRASFMCLDADGEGKVKACAPLKTCRQPTNGHDAIQR